MTVGDMPAAVKVLLQIGAPCTRTLRPFSSAMLCTGLLAKMLRVPPPANPISITSAFCDLVGEGLQRVGVEHLVPMVEISGQERRVAERGASRERGHVRRREDAVDDRDALFLVG